LECSSHEERPPLRLRTTARAQSSVAQSPKRTAGECLHLRVSFLEGGLFFCTPRGGDLILVGGSCRMKRMCDKPCVSQDEAIRVVARPRKQGVLTGHQVGSIEPKQAFACHNWLQCAVLGSNNRFDLTLERTGQVSSGNDPGNSELIPLLDVVA
jgi:hypothetical protein